MMESSHPAPDVRLTEIQRAILSHGLLQWGGPARLSEDLARAMGFSGIESFREEAERIRDALLTDLPLSAHDWRRALLATEIVFASDTVGAGVEWPIVSGFDDHETLTELRAIQREILRGISHS